MRVLLSLAGAACLALTGLPALADPPPPASPRPSAAPPAAVPPNDGDPRFTPGRPALPGTASVVRERWTGPRMLDLLVSSPATGRLVPVRLLLPPGWSKTDRIRTWPVLYLLHGRADNYTAWTRMSDVAAMTEGVEAIVVMPDAGRDASYADARWAAFHTRELRRLLEREYRAGRRRAVAGQGEGGYGALAYATAVPALFRFAGAYGGPLTGPGTGGDPLVLAPRLRGLGVYLAGEGAGAISRRLGALGIEHTLSPARPASWPAWNRAFASSFPMILTALGLPGGGPASELPETPDAAAGPAPGIPDAVPPAPLPLGVLPSAQGG
ncbi:alpha/beta hydrolase-fold protein [Nonomuraea sp. NPDC050310]|uniref:alpha/beta hydrolase n=1 Tax=Nonomuraea sp. NPDC050310 TaxID=3154935 RepID=UPI0033D5EEA0